MYLASCSHFGLVQCVLDLLTSCVLHLSPGVLQQIILTYNYTCFETYCCCRMMYATLCFVLAPDSACSYFKCLVISGCLHYTPKPSSQAPKSISNKPTTNPHATCSTATSYYSFSYSYMCLMWHSMIVLVCYNLIRQIVINSDHLYMPSVLLQVLSFHQIATVCIPTIQMWPAHHVIVHCRVPLTICVHDVAGLGGISLPRPCQAIKI